MKKILSSLLTLTIVLFSILVVGNNIFAMEAPYLSIVSSKDIISSDNAILNASFYNKEEVLVEAFEIKLLCNNVEVLKYKKPVNSRKKNLEAEFNIKKDTGVELEANSRYDYRITALTKEEVASEMYTNGFHFVTHNVKVKVLNEKEKSGSVFLDVKVDNPDNREIKKIGVKVYLEEKLVKDYYRIIDESDESLDISFDIKKDTGVSLKENKKYEYIVYASLENDVNRTMMGMDDGEFVLIGKVGVRSTVEKKIKTIVISNKINNPFLKKISNIKVIVKAGKRQRVVYNKKVVKKKKYLRKTTIKIELNKARIKEIAKVKKYVIKTHVKIGRNLYKTKLNNIKL